MPETPAYPKSLTHAVAQLQAELPVIHKGGRATVKTKQGYDYSYSYADLADMAPLVYPLLGKYGLAFICCPTYRGTRFGLVGRLEHTSGESRHGWWPLPEGVDAQTLGSAMTYGRRYLLGCLTGVVTGDEDDDGPRPVGRGTPPATNGHTRTSRQRPPAGPADKNGDLTDGDLAGIYKDKIDAAEVPGDLLKVIRAVNGDEALSDLQKDTLHQVYDEKMATFRGGKR